MRAKAIGHLYEAKDVTIRFRDGTELRAPSGDVIVSETTPDFTVSINNDHTTPTTPIENIHAAVKALWARGKPPRPFIQCGRCLARLDVCECGIADDVRRALAEYEEREALWERERQRKATRDDFIRAATTIATLGHAPEPAPTRVGVDAEDLLPRMNRHERRAARARNRKR